MVQKNIDYWTKKALEYRISGNVRLCLNALNEALMIEPNDPNLLLSRGAMLVELGYLDEALVAVEKSLEFDPHIADSWYYKGLILYKKEEHEKSLSALEEAQRLDPADVRVLIHLFMVLGVMGQRKEALEAFEKAKKCDPEYTEHWLRGLHHMADLDMTQAQNEFESANKSLSEKYTKKKDLA